MTKFFLRGNCPLFLVGLVLILAGCFQDDKIGSVSGTISIDGTPLNFAMVSFIPEFGRASVGRTNEEGKYTLNYISGKKGALIGKHKVTVSTKYIAETNYNLKTYDEEGPVKPSRGDMIRSAGRKETMPDKYRNSKKTELTAEVKKGENEINFDLKLK